MDCICVDDIVQLLIACTTSSCQFARRGGPSHMVAECTAMQRGLKVRRHCDVVLLSRRRCRCITYSAVGKDGACARLGNKRPAGSGVTSAVRSVATIGGGMCVANRTARQAERDWCADHNFL